MGAEEHDLDLIELLRFELLVEGICHFRREIPALLSEATGLRGQRKSSLGIPEKSFPISAMPLTTESQVYYRA